MRLDHFEAGKGLDSLRYLAGPPCPGEVDDETPHAFIGCSYVGKSCGNRGEVSLRECTLALQLGDVLLYVSEEVLGLEITEYRFTHVIG